MRIFIKAPTYVMRLIYEWQIIPHSTLSKLTWVNRISLTRISLNCLNLTSVNLIVAVQIFKFIIFTKNIYSPVTKQSNIQGFVPLTKLLFPFENAVTFLYDCLKCPKAIEIIEAMHKLAVIFVNWPKNDFSAIGRQMPKMFIVINYTGTKAINSKWLLRMKIFTGI